MDRAKRRARSKRRQKELRRARSDGRQREAGLVGSASVEDIKPPTADGLSVSAETAHSTGPELSVLVESDSAAGDGRVIDLPFVALSIAAGTSAEWSRLAHDYWHHSGDAASGSSLTWTHRIADLELPEDAPEAARRAGWVSRVIADFSQARFRDPCPECGQLPLVLSRAAAESRQKRTWRSACGECVERRAAAARAEQQAAAQSERDQARRRQGAVAELSTVVGGGHLQLDELRLAEALLLRVLTAGASVQGVIGATANWSRPVANLVHDDGMITSWSRLDRMGIIRPHPSSPVSGFVWDEHDGIEDTYLERVTWYVARGPDGASLVRSCELANQLVDGALRAGQWPSGWSLDAPDLARQLIAAEGLRYFLYGLDDRQFPRPNDVKQAELRAAMLDAAADFSVGQMLYLSWKPLKDASDAYRRNDGMTVAAATSHAVNQMAKRAPQVRANGWTADVYNQPAAVPVAAVTVAFFDSLGLAWKSDGVQVVAETVKDRAPRSDLDTAADMAAEERLLAAEPLPPGLWERTLDMLDRNSVADPNFPGWRPPGTDAFFDLMDAARVELAQSTAEWMREAARAGEQPGELFSEAYASVILAAHAACRQLADGEDAEPRKVYDLAVAIGGSLKYDLLTVYREATDTGEVNEP